DRLPAQLPQRRDAGRRRRPAAGRPNQPPIGAVPAGPARRRPQRPAGPPGAPAAAGGVAPGHVGARPPPPPGRIPVRPPPRRPPGAGRPWPAAVDRAGHGGGLVRRAAPEALVTVRYEVVHRTTYSYAEAVEVGHTVAHLRPRELAHQRVEDAAVEVEPGAAF